MMPSRGAELTTTTMDAEDEAPPPVFGATATEKTYRPGCIAPLLSCSDAPEHPVVETRTASQITGAIGAARPHSGLGSHVVALSGAAATVHVTDVGEGYVTSAVSVNLSEARALGVA